MAFPSNRIVDRPAMAIEAFRAFQVDRPDEEAWELIDGVPVMMTPTHLGHARIAGNIERLLSDALDLFDPSRIALHEIGVDLGLDSQMLAGLGRGDHYAPQPDVGVIDAQFDADQRFAKKLYVAVEIVSSADDGWIASVGMRWIAAKANLYKAHRDCEAVVVVEQHHVEVRLSTRSDRTWRHSVLTRLDDDLALPTCGLACKVRDLYRGTPLAPRLVKP